MRHEVSWVDDCMIFARNCVVNREKSPSSNTACASRFIGRQDCNQVYFVRADSGSGRLIIIGYSFRDYCGQYRTLGSCIKLNPDIILGLLANGSTGSYQPSQRAPARPIGSILLFFLSSPQLTPPTANVKRTASGNHLYIIILALIIVLSALITCWFPVVILALPNEPALFLRLPPPP